MLKQSQALLKSFRRKPVKMELALPERPQESHFDARAFQRRIYLETGRRLYLPHDVDALGLGDMDDPARQALQKTLWWLREAIMKPHPSMGRKGPVCPYVKTAIDANVLFLTVANPEDPDSPKDIEAEMEAYSRIFNSLPPLEPEIEMLKCFMILFPETDLDVFRNQQQLGRMKTRYLPERIMLGRFGPEKDINKLLEAKFFPFEAPGAFYVMRKFNETDWEFIKREAPWRKIYNELFPKDSTPG